MAKHWPVLVAVMAFCGPLITNAATFGPVITTTPIPLTLVDWTSALTYPQFDPGLGTLTDIGFSTTVNISSEITLQNLSDSTIYGYCYVQVRQTEKLYSNTSLVSLPLVDLSFTLNPGQTLTTTKTKSMTNGNTTLNGYVLPQYIGTETVSLPAFTKTEFNLSEIPDFAASQVTQAALTGSLTYIYTPVTAGDFGHDGSCNAHDIQPMMNALVDLSAYQSNWRLSDAQMKTVGDFDSDNSVTNTDLQGFIDFLANRAGGGTLSPVPEPSTFALAALGAVAVLAARLRLS